LSRVEFADLIKKMQFLVILITLCKKMDEWSNILKF